MAEKNLSVAEGRVKESFKYHDGERVVVRVDGKKVLEIEEEE